MLDIVTPIRGLAENTVSAVGTYTRLLEEMSSPSRYWFCRWKGCQQWFESKAARTEHEAKCGYKKDVDHFVESDEETDPSPADTKASAPLKATRLAFKHATIVSGPAPLAGPLSKHQDLDVLRNTNGVGRRLVTKM